MRQAGGETRVTEDVQVMYYDTDAGGVVHNIAYLRIIEFVRTKLAIALGMSFDEIKRTGIHPVVTRTEIDYRKPAVLGDVLRIDGWIDEHSKARFWCAFDIRRASDGVQLVTCKQALALVQMPEGRPLRLPSNFPAQFAPEA